MRKLNLTLLFLSLTTVLADYAPVLSTTGRQRVLDNAATLDKNIATVSGNIINCKKNASVIETEIKDLTQLEQEHLQLREKYKEQVTSTEHEIEKNNIAIKELETFQKNISKNAPEGKENPPSQQEDLLRSQKDKSDREKWKSEAQSKIEKMNELIKSVNFNLNEIDKKKKPLRDQLNQWQAREKLYQKMLAELTNRKSESNKILQSQN